MKNKVSEYANSDSWQQLLGFLPKDWENKCRETGALKRLRGFDGASSLLRTLLIHLLDGCSLRETVVRARIGKIADISDVALLKRLNHSGEWFRWMSLKLKDKWQGQYTQALLPDGLKVRVVDATHVSEPGATGTDWRIHYAFDLDDLACKEIKVTDYTVGETLRNYTVEPDVVYIGDRGYYHHTGIEHVVKGKAHVLIRMSVDNRPINNIDGTSFDVLAHLRKLKGTCCGDWPVHLIGTGSTKIAGRICAIKRSKQAAEYAMEKVIKTCRRKGRVVRKPALESAKYVFIFTTLPSSVLSAKQALETYRGRWQIELVFKRLKSIIGLGHLPKQDPQGALAWIYGKLFGAFLIESLIQASEHFFPWGYPITNLPTKSMA